MELVLAVSQVQLARLIAVAFLFKRSPRSWFTASTGVVSAEAVIIDQIKTPEQLKSPGIVRGFFILHRCTRTIIGGPRSRCGLEQPTIVTDLRCGTLGRAGLLFHRKGTAYQHKIVVGRAAFIAADKLAMDAIEVAANAAVTCGFEHLTNPDRSNDRSSGGLQSALADRIGLVEIHDVR